MQQLGGYQIREDLGRGGFCAADTPPCSMRTTVRRQLEASEAAGLWSGSSERRRYT